MGIEYYVRKRGSEDELRKRMINFRYSINMRLDAVESDLTGSLCGVCCVYSNLAFGSGKRG